MDLTIQEAVLESKRCLNCKAPQCVKGCPVGNEIPRWVHALSMGNFGEAMDIINIHSNLPAVCSRVCAHERQCEGHCVLGKKGDPLRIGALERFISQFDADINLSRETIPCKDKGRVAVIGSGPAGLTVAGVLARRGYDVEIFEREPQPGGMLMFGIPEYRLPKEVVQNEIEKIAHLGVKINCDVTVGVDMTVDDTV
ncbi:MAG: NAD(P)-binding protein, partial [Muribaculaceae bacterium]|nr:NAD(P)-binding protein [Muribaculaceae bacterium]